MCDQEQLDVEMSGDRGKPQAVATVLRSTAGMLERAPDDMTISFRLEVWEVDDD